MSRFSRQGEPCTAFERQLVEVAGDESALWLVLTRRIGLDAAVAIMDECGGEHVYVPSRNGFFAALLAEVRAAEIVRRLSARDRPVDVARDLGMTRQAVDKAWRKAQATARRDGLRAGVVKGRR